MATELVLNIQPDGNLRMIYNEVLDLEELGVQVISRASLVEWDEESRLWSVSMPDGTPLQGGFMKRSAAIAWEVEFWNNRL
jgi:hypothetical protein